MTYCSFLISFLLVECLAKSALNTQESDQYAYSVNQVIFPTRVGE